VPLSLVHLLDDPLPHRVRIPHQHADVPMAADRSHLTRCHTHLEEAADGFMAEIVEVEVGATG
jgi:hypothetical protein